VHLEDQELDILQPLVELVKVHESNDFQAPPTATQGPPPRPSKQSSTHPTPYPPYCLHRSLP
jgi:hypothetical protein